MVYPADDTILRLRLLTKEIRELTACVRAEIDRSRSNLPVRDPARRPQPSGGGTPVL